MSQNHCNNPNMSTRLRNNTPANQQNQYQQVRGRSRNRQFRLLSTPDVLDMGDDATPSAPTVLNIVVPSHISSETSVISSRTNVASLNVVSKSSLPSNMLDPMHNFDENSQFSKMNSWMEDPQSTIRSSPKKCQSKTEGVAKCTSKEGKTEPLPIKSCQPLNYSKHDVKYLKQRLIKYRNETESCGDAAKLNGQLNEIFVRRLVDIENVAKNDSDIKLLTYQEWVDMLMQINEVIIGNMADLESEVAERLECMKRKIKSSCSQTSNIEQKYRQDICSLMQLLKNAYHHDNWDTQGLDFQTVNITEILCPRKPTCPEQEHRDNIKECFDDDQESRNRCCVNDPECVLENVIFDPPNIRLTQKTSSICECGDESTIHNMPPINLEQQSSRSASTQVSAGLESCIQFPFFAEECSVDSLSTAGHVEHQKLKALEIELNELFEVTKDFKNNNLEYHRKRLSDIFKTSEAEKAEAYKKLDFIRKQLVNLEMSSGESSKQGTNDSDSGFSSKCDSDHDAKILNTLRHRLRRINNMNFELKKCVQMLRIENSELSTSLKTEKTFAQRNSDTLKDLADMLSGMSGKQFAYDDIYNENFEPNPFCQAIIQMKCDFEEKERTLRNSLSKKIEQNENLRGQVQQLQCKMLEKEQCIGKLNHLLDQLRCEQKAQQQRDHECCLQIKDKEMREMCQKLEQANKKVESLMSELERSQKQERFLLCETRKLNEELNENKRKHSDLSVQMHRLNSLLKSQDSCRADICKKYEEMERNYEDQAKQLRAACSQMNCLQERLAIMDKLQEEHNMERNLLRDEVLALKEKEATLLTKHKCLTEKLMKTEKELYIAHDVMKEQQHIMQRNESSQKDSTKRLQDANNELKRQFNTLCDDYKQLEEELRKQWDLRKQNEKVIESFRKWKEAQLKADDATRASFKQYEEHIKLLLEEKQRFIEQYRSLHGDYCTLQHELERIRMCSLSFNNSAPTSNLSENSIPQRMELIRSTSLRVSQASSSLKCDVTSQDASGSNPP